MINTPLPKNPYRLAHYILGAASFHQLPIDQGIEVALAGRSNAGKSTALNMITDQKHLAKTSKTPGRTQLINLFHISDERRLVDLPGYGFAKVAKEQKENWQATLSTYLQKRLCLKGLIVFMDIRHPLKAMDKQMIQWAIASDIPVHAVLSKADKLKSGARKASFVQVKQQLLKMSQKVSVQVFSATQKMGVDELMNQLNLWYFVKDPSQKTQHSQE
jgi:GTP-binding protein